MSISFRLHLARAIAMLIVGATAGTPGLSDEPAGKPGRRHSEIWGEDPLSLTVRMQVSPAAEPKPALKYRFLVPPVDQVRANAATFYYKALAVQEINWRPAGVGDERLMAWQEKPSEEFPVAEVKKEFGLARNDEFRTALRDAARADYCQWGDPIRELGVNTPLEAAQHTAQHCPRPGAAHPARDRRAPPRRRRRDATAELRPVTPPGPGDHDRTKLDRHCD